jgi:hypothetical protein
MRPQKVALTEFINSPYTSLIKLYSDLAVELNTQRTYWDK